MEIRHRPLLLLQEVGFVVFLDEELNASHPHLAFVHTRRHQVEDVFVDVVLQNQTETALLLKKINSNTLYVSSTPKTRCMSSVRRLFSVRQFPKILTMLFCLYKDFVKVLMAFQ